MILVPVSGGKDSQACLKLAIEHAGAKNVKGLFCDTQFEAPETYDHVDFMSELYGVEIDKVTAGSVDEKVRKYGRFPGGGARHCTEELKIIPTKKYCNELSKSKGGFVVYYGMRLNESAERGKRYEGKTHDDFYMPHEIMPGKYPKYLAAQGVVFMLPILTWSSREVFDFLEGKHNPLYNQGFERVGCFPCLAGGDASKKRAFEHNDFGRAQRIRVKNLEDEIGKSIYTSKATSQRDNKDQGDLFEGCGVCAI